MDRDHIKSTKGVVTVDYRQDDREAIDTTEPGKEQNYRCRSSQPAPELARYIYLPGLSSSDPLAEEVRQPHGLAAGRGHQHHQQPRGRVCGHEPHEQ